MAEETYYLTHEMLRVTKDDRAVVIGLGPFGMLCLEHLREIGCGTIIAVDLIDSRLELAHELGATHVVNAAREDLVVAVAAVGPAPSVVIETSGQPKPIVQAIKVAGKEARVALAGRAYKTLDGFEIEDFFHKMLTVIGARIPPAGYNRKYVAIALEMIKQDRIHAGKLVTHEFPLHRVGEAFELATHAEMGGLKVVVNCMV